jgi:hypothetical protein
VIVSFFGTSALQYVSRLLLLLTPLGPAEYWQHSKVARRD